MSLNDELNDFFAQEEEQIIDQPILFKEKLGIGEKAYAFLRYRGNLSTFSEAIGIGATASGIASSSMVASTFFAPASSGFIASALSTVGLGATAATPVGWIIGAGVIAGGAYVGISRLFESPKNDGMVVIPKYINTPLEALGAALLELMLPVSLKMAAADGEISAKERSVISNHYVANWGFNPVFVQKLMAQFEQELANVSYSKLVSSLVAYTEDSPDCDREAIMGSVLTHLREIAEADGQVHTNELNDLKFISEQLLSESKKQGMADQALASLSESFATITETTRATASRAANTTGQGARFLLGGISEGALKIGNSAKQGGLLIKDAVQKRVSSNRG